MGVVSEVDITPAVGVVAVMDVATARQIQNIILATKVNFDIVKLILDGLTEPTIRSQPSHCCLCF